jgi:hypothetical protein
VGLRHEFVFVPDARWSCDLVETYYLQATAVVLDDRKLEARLRTLRKTPHAEGSRGAPGGCRLRLDKGAAAGIDR